MDIYLWIVIALISLFVYYLIRARYRRFKNIVVSQYARSFEIYIETYCDLETEIVKKGLRESCPELNKLRDDHLTIVSLCTVDVNKTKLKSLIKVTDILNETTNKIESYYPRLV